jgi:hypothetical protein
MGIEGISLLVPPILASVCLHTQHSACATDSHLYCLHAWLAPLTLALIAFVLNVTLPILTHLDLVTFASNVTQLTTT